LSEKKQLSECVRGTVLELVARHIPGALLKKEPVGFGDPHRTTGVTFSTVRFCCRCRKPESA